MCRHAAVPDSTGPSGVSVTNGRGFHDEASGMRATSGSATGGATGRWNATDTGQDEPDHPGAAPSPANQKWLTRSATIGFATTPSPSCATVTVATRSNSGDSSSWPGITSVTTRPSGASTRGRRMVVEVVLVEV